MTGRPALWDLAVQVGIVRAWTDAAGRRRRTSPATAEALCGALGLTAHSEQAARAEVQRLRMASGAMAVRLDPADRCVLPADRGGVRRHWGLLTSLYSVRSGRNQGVGDLTDLRSLVDWTAQHGGAFVGINPLHAIRNRGTDVSPYSPVSRFFGNPVYLDPEAVPEFGEVAAAPSRASPELRDALRLDYDALAGLKTSALETLYRRFSAVPREKRAAAFRRYEDQEGPALTDFATFQALEEQYGRPWTSWPPALRRIGSPAVARFREEQANRVDYHRWVQFELDRQLAAVADRARRRMPIGLVGDLAIGTAPDGCDPWMFPDLFVHGASLGAPPDAYAPEGQDWGFPPLNPLRLAETGCAYWISLLRATMRHVGGLRIDHVMGLYRQYWIPAGGSPADGTYVRFPGDALLALLCRESARRQAIVIGEDLGTVPRGLPNRLRHRGVLSTRMFYFQRDRRGTFLRPDDYPDRALVSATTHDHAPVRGFLAGADLTRRHQAGAMDGASLRAALEERGATRRRLVNRLVRSGLLAMQEAESEDAIVTAVHAFLAQTPCSLFGVMHDDLAGESEPVNLPGVPQERWPSWTRRMTQPLESLGRDATARRILGVLRSRSLEQHG